MWNVVGEGGVEVAGEGLVRCMSVNCVDEEVGEEGVEGVVITADGHRLRCYRGYQHQNFSGWLAGGIASQTEPKNP